MEKSLCPIQLPSPQSSLESRKSDWEEVSGEKSSLRNNGWPLVDWVASKNRKGNIHSIPQRPSKCLLVTHRCVMWELGESSSPRSTTAWLPDTGQLHCLAGPPLLLRGSLVALPALTVYNAHQHRERNWKLVPAKMEPLCSFCSLFHHNYLNYLEHISMLKSNCGIFFSSFLFCCCCLWIQLVLFISLGGNF